MGSKDSTTKDYMRDPVVFADVFNQYVYEGEQVIQPEQLTELDTTEIVLPYGDDEDTVPEQRYRDLAKMMSSMTDGRSTYCILALENESKINYAMPVKNCLYDIMHLDKQVRDAARRYHKKRGSKMSPDEYLSGFRKKDRLIPVITLVFYFGADKWDGPLSLGEMYQNCDNKLMKFAPDYHINLIAPHNRTDEEIDRYQTNLREITRYIKYSNDKKALDDLLKRDKRFQNVDREAADLINTVTGSNIKYPAGKGKVNMCLAIEEMKDESKLEGKREGRLEGRREGKLEGRLEGTIETCRKLGMKLDAAVEYVSKEFGKSDEEARTAVTQYWK